MVFQAEGLANVETSGAKRTWDEETERSFLLLNSKGCFWNEVERSALRSGLWDIIQGSEGLWKQL